MGRLAHELEKMREGWPTSGEDVEDWHISLRRCGKVGTSAGEAVGRLAHQRETI